MENNKKFQFDHKIFSTCIYAIITTVICAIFIRAIWHWDSTKDLFSGLLSSLSPFLIGFFIAYIMGNISYGIENQIFTKILPIKNVSLKKGLSLILSYVIVFALIGGAFFIIIPALIQSISDMAGSINELYNRLVSLVNDLSEQYPNPTVEYIRNAIQQSIPTYIDYFRDWAASLAPSIANASMSLVKWVLNLIVAVIVSIYILLDKNILSRSFQRIIYSVLSEKQSAYVWNTILKANDIFSAFIIGKSIDSFIIGILCLVLMKIFGIGGSYVVIISIVIGITNMIPYFGPFLGGIPSAVIIFLSVSPKQAIVFAILIIILQQFDGNILGPYILGDKTGLRPIWIIFAISIGGWIGGIVGMFLGVPCVAVISNILDELVEKGLEKKNIELPPVDTVKENVLDTDKMKDLYNKLLSNKKNDK